MKTFLIFLLIIFLVLIQRSLIPFNLLLLLIISTAAYDSVRKALKVAFLTGILLDLNIGKTLGSSSFLFCLITLIFFLYTRRFSSRHPVFIGIFTLLSVGFTDRFQSGQFSWDKAVVLALISLGLRLMIGSRAGFESDEGIRLKV